MNQTTAFTSIVVGTQWIWPWSCGVSPSWYFTHMSAATHRRSAERVLRRRAFTSAKHICVFPALLLISLDSSSVSVYREYLSQWHSQFAPWGEWLRVIQQPPRSASSLTTGTHQPLRCLGYFSRRSETSTDFLELTQAFLHYVFVVAGSFLVSSGPLVHVMHPAARARLSVLQHKLCCGGWGFQHLARAERRSCDPSLQCGSFLAAVWTQSCSAELNNLCGLTNELLKRLLRSKTKWQGRKL